MTDHEAINSKLTEIATHVKYIREDLQEVKSAVKEHDNDIRDAKSSIRIIKWLGGIVTAVAAFFGLGGH